MLVHKFCVKTIVDEKGIRTHQICTIDKQSVLAIHNQTKEIIHQKDSCKNRLQRKRLVNRNSMLLGLCRKDKMLCCDTKIFVSQFYLWVCSGKGAYIILNMLHLQNRSIETHYCLNK